EFAFAECRVTACTPRSVDVEVSTMGRRLLVLTDTYYPGWRVTVDSKPAEMLRADLAFRAVVVEGGLHDVRFAYEPGSFRCGPSRSERPAAKRAAKRAAGRRAGREASCRPPSGPRSPEAGNHGTAAAPPSSWCERLRRELLCSLHRWRVPRLDLD